MPVNVRFPDGTVRSVPSQPKLLKSKTIGGNHDRIIDEPAYDPDWRYVAVIGGWLARPRND